MRPFGSTHFEGDCGVVYQDVQTVVSFLDVIGQPSDTLDIFQIELMKLDLVLSRWLRCL